MSVDSQIVLEDHDGFIAGLYHLLWQKNISGETCPGMLLPDLILYKYRIPAYWYFTGSDGSLKRKSKASIVNKKIYADFTKGADKSDGASARGAHPRTNCVARAVPRGSPKPAAARDRRSPHPPSHPPAPRPRRSRRLPHLRAEA